MKLIVDTTAAFFRIREHTGGKFVAVGDDGNIRRWSETGGPEQDWMFLPMGERNYRIMTRQNGEYMAVGSNGNIVRWAKSLDNSQIFRLVNEDAAGKSMNIQEPTRNEFVAVGSDGNILRWGTERDNTKWFTLEAHNPPAKPLLPAIEAEPGKIGDVPRLKKVSLVDFPLKTEPKIVAVSLVPATMVNDPTYSDKVAQMEANPYYIGVRRQYWSREDKHGYSFEHKQGEGSNFKETITYEVTNRSTKTSEEIWGWKFSINAENSVSAKEDGVGFTATQGMAFEISRQFRTEMVEENIIQQKSEKSVGREYDASEEDFVIVGWSLVDRYTLYKKDLTSIVSEVDAGSQNSLIKDSFPHRIPDPE